jgi:hypothetical protein
MQEAFLQLSKSAANYGAVYSQVAESMTEKLIGKKVYTRQTIEFEDNSPGWASWAMGFFSLALGNVAGVALAGAGFDWKNILLNSLAVIGIWSFLSIFSMSLVAAPIGILLLGLGIGAMQAEQARKELIQATKKEFVKHLPQIAQEQGELINQAVKECFDAYEREVAKRINDDIKSRKSELDNLLKQKESYEINFETELNRLRKLETDVLSECQSIETAYEHLLASPA